MKPSEWEKAVRFEHARPLRAMYEAAEQERGTLTIWRLLNIVGEHPPVVVTREEDQAIPGRFRSTGHPDARYVGIKLSFRLSSDRWRVWSWIDGER
jgi:hypothetical protein